MGSVVKATLCYGLLFEMNGDNVFEALPGHLFKDFNGNSEAIVNRWFRSLKQEPQSDKDRPWGKNSGIELIWSGCSGSYCGSFVLASKESIIETEWSEVKRIYIDGIDCGDLAIPLFAHNELYAFCEAHGISALHNPPSWYLVAYYG